MGDIFAYSGRFSAGTEIRSLPGFPRFYAEFLKICFILLFIYTVSSEMGNPMLWRTGFPKGKNKYGKGEGTMRKLLGALLTVLVMVLGACAALADNAQISYVPETIVIDGEIDEAWSRAGTICLDKAYYQLISTNSGSVKENTPLDAPTTGVNVKTLWNGNVVCLLIDVDDDTIQDRDKITVGLDLMNDKLPLTEEDDAVITISPNSGSVNVTWGGLNTPEFQRLTGASVKRKTDGEGHVTGYVAELGFFISDYAFRGGENLGFDLSVFNAGTPVSSSRVPGEFISYHAETDFSSGDNKCNLYGTVALEAPTEEQWAQRPLDKSLLNSRIGMAEALPHGIWEDETALADALDAAKAVYADDTADRDAVDAAAAALQAAIDNMRHVDRVSGYNLPDLQDTPALDNLPDPFTFLDGSAVTADNWSERAEEIKAMVQYYEYGFMPDEPDSVTATYSPSSNRITITVKAGDKSASFNSYLFLPTGEKDFYEDGKIPLMVNLSFSGSSGNNTTINNAGYAVASFTYSSVAADSNSHTGAFYNLYPYDVEQYGDRGTLIAWSWGASRVLDALEYLNENDENLKGKLDLSRIGVTGQSRLGKTALVAGLMDERFGVTAPQESGSGGAGTYRYVSYSTEEYPLQYSWANSPASGSEVLPHRPRNQGWNHNQMLYYALDDRWFGEDFPNTSMGSRLPYDKNLMLAALAPRGVYVICSNNDDANNPYGDATSYEGALPVFRALGVEDNLALDVGMKNAGHSTSTDQFERLVEYMNWYFYGIEMSDETRKKLRTNPFEEEGAYARYGGLATMMENYTGLHYEITFNPGEGSGEMDKAYVVSGDKLTLPENSFTAPELKEFAAWDAGSPSDEISVSGSMTVTALWQDIPNTYTFITGSSGTWTRGCGKAMEFTVKGSPNDAITFDLFGGILMDGKAVPAGSYTATRGSVNISVSADYLESLSDGSHTVTVGIGDAAAETIFTIASPATPTDLGGDPATPTDLEEDPKPAVTEKPAATEKPASTSKPVLPDSGSYDFQFSFIVRWDAGPADSIDWVLYHADGSEAHKKFNKKVVGNEWRYEAWFSAAGDYYIVENVPAGYKVRYENTGTHAGVTDRCYNGGTIVNYKVPQTGDTADPLLWVVSGLLGLLALFLAWQLFRDHKADKR